MNSERDVALALDFHARAAEARLHLRAQMESHGLHEADGWKISETVRQRPDGVCELHMCPLHLHLKAPPGIECVVSLDPEEKAVESDCTP
jgi:hypothetical protein